MTAATAVTAGAAALAGEDGRAVRAVIEAFTAAFARGDVDAIRPLFTPDAVVYPSNDRDRVGWDDIAAYWEPPFAAMRIALQVDLHGLSLCGDLAVAEMVTRAGITPKAGGETVRKRYRDMVVLRRDGGVWRIHRNLSQAYPETADV